MEDFNIFQTDYSSYNSAGQMFSYYPKYALLDELLVSNPYKQINIFVDVKGCSPALFQEWAVKQIIDKSRSGKTIDYGVFQSVLEFISFHKKYQRKRDITFKFHFFMEQGKSQYHRDIFKDYKKDREITDFFGLDFETRQYFNSVLDKNYDILEYMCNKLPNVSFYKIKYLEADFLPYYVMKHVMDQQELHNSVNIVYSRDKDMLQCLEFPNSYQFHKWNNPSTNMMICERNLLQFWSKDKEARSIKDSAKWFPFFLSLVGDGCDSIPGIKGVGAKTICKHLDHFEKIYGTADNMYEKVISGVNVLTESKKIQSSITVDKFFSEHDIIQRNMKLISYRALSDCMNEGIPGYMIDVKKYIQSKFHNTDKITNPKIISDGLSKQGMPIDEEIINNLF